MSAYLQLRWEKNDGKHGWDHCNGWLCHYELVLPLREHDIRREDENLCQVRDKVTVALKGPSLRYGDSVPCTDRNSDAPEFDTPYRDGVHATWDGEALGGLPIYVIAPDGTKIPEPDEWKQRRADAAKAEGTRP